LTRPAAVAASAKSDRGKSYFGGGLVLVIVLILVLLGKL
jgi:hypothetical protein